MKFGKELASQMVQEWGEAYMDYTSLKGLLKDILKFRQTKAAAQSSAAATLKNSLKRRLSMYRAFSGLANRFSTTPRSNDNNEEDIILVSGVEQEGSIGAPPQYQTTFLVSSEAGGEYELVFFRRLDDEFNKVVGFYREKVEEARKEADELSEQMDALIAFRIMVQKPEIQLRAAAQRKDNNSAAATNARKQGHEFESLLF